MRLKSIGGIHETGHRKFREFVVTKLGKEYEIKIKSKSWNPFHSTSDETLTRYWGQEPPPGGQRREIFSLDGRRLPQRPDENETYNLFKRIFETKKRKVELGRIGGEVIYGKEAGLDPMAQLRGLVRAYIEHTKLKPENMDKYPEPLPLPAWLETKQPGEPEPEPPQPPKESIEGISIDEIINWIKRNPWIIQLISDSPDNKKFKEALVKYFEKSTAWQKEKQQKLQELTETGSTPKHLQTKMQQIAQMKAQALEIETDTMDSLKRLLQKKNTIILELETALQISNTLFQSHHLFYTKEFELRYIANGILKDAGDIGKTNLLVIGIGGYYDPWKKTYGAGIFVGLNIRSLLKILL
jgi:hypothetical protein